MFLLLVTSPALLAAEPDWQPVATDLLKREKTGFGGLCGVIVDHATGDVWVNLSDCGVFHSGDQGKTWKRATKKLQGRTESPGCWLFDPVNNGDVMVMPLVYGAPVALKTVNDHDWKHLDNKTNHVDWCAVDWSGPLSLKFNLVLKHESGGLLLASVNHGPFTEVGKGYGTGWVFDGQTAVVAQAKSKTTPKPNLMRTTDGAKTWRPCGEYSPVGANSAQALPKWHDGTLYWLTESGLIATTDKGETWKKIGELKGAQYGPIFGKDAKHMFVLARAGVVESMDGGASWSKPLPPPKDMKGIGGLSWLEYDPINDVIYLMKMGSDLYRLTRAK